MLSDIATVDEIATLKRRELQTLAKQNSIKATQKSVDLIKALQELWATKNGNPCDAGVVDVSTAPASADREQMEDDAEAPKNEATTSESNFDTANAIPEPVAETKAAVAETTAASLEESQVEKTAVPPAVQEDMVEVAGKLEGESSGDADASAAVAVMPSAPVAAPVATKEAKTLQAAAAAAAGDGSAQSGEVRFSKAHQRLFAGQPSITSAFMSPHRQSMLPKPASHTHGGIPRPAAKTPGQLRASGGASSTTSSNEENNNDAESSATGGVSAATKPCTFAAQKPVKKTTVVEPFNLSGKGGKRPDGFEFRPYSGPVSRDSVFSDKTNAAAGPKAPNNTPAKPRTSLAPQAAAPNAAAAAAALHLHAGLPATPGGSGMSGQQQPAHRIKLKSTPTRADVRQAHLDKAASASKQKRAAHVAALRG